MAVTKHTLPSRKKRRPTRQVTSTALGATLNRLMDEHGYTGKRLAEKTGLQASFISRIKTGEQKFIARDDLVNISSFFSRNESTGEPTPFDPAQLVWAHLMDEKVGVGADLVEVTIRHSRKGEIDPKIGLSDEAERALAFIRNQVGSQKAAERFLIDFASMLGMYPKTKKE
jgi:transcriptional regulator with XRE-family HTH domain